MGGDCATSHSFGYANSPLERVFIIRNKKGDDVGYLNGTHITFPNGKKGFFINTIAGGNISGAMADNIFSGINKVKKNLGVEEIAILGSNQEVDNIRGFTHIQDSYQRHRGKDVRLSFPDKEIREAINQDSYDSVEFLEDASRLVNTDDSTTVFVETRSRNPVLPSIEQFLEEYGKRNQSEMETIFHTILNSSTPLPKNLLEIAFKKGFDINAENIKGDTFYRRYISYGTLEGIKYFHAKGGLMQTKNKFLNNHLQAYALNPNPTLEGVAYLVDNGVNATNKNKHLMTPLHLFAKNPNTSPEIIRYLINKGANVRARNIKGHNPLDVYLSANEKVDPAIIRLLDPNQV